MGQFLEGKAKQNLSPGNCKSFESFIFLSTNERAKKYNTEINEIKSNLKKGLDDENLDLLNQDLKMISDLLESRSSEWEVAQQELESHQS